MSDELKCQPGRYDHVVFSVTIRGPDNKQWSTKFKVAIIKDGKLSEAELKRSALMACRQLHQRIMNGLSPVDVNPEGWENSWEQTAKDDKKDEE